MMTTYMESIVNLILRKVNLLRELLDRRTTFVFLFEAVRLAVDAVYGTHLIEGQPDDTALLGNSLQNALPNPPHGIGDKLKTTRLVKLLGSFDKSHVALVDKV